MPFHISEDNKKLSYCWDSSRYDKISDSGRSVNPVKQEQLGVYSWQLKFIVQA